LNASVQATKDEHSSRIGATQVQINAGGEGWFTPLKIHHPRH